jgi:predicted DNA-binding transcriptional regulator AlpA
MGQARALERVRPQDAVVITGLSLRTVQALALRGEIPGAAKLGGSWTFDEAALRNWIKERTTCPQDRRHLNTRTGEVIRYGRGSPLQDENIARACELMTRKLRERASRR